MMRNLFLLIILIAFTQSAMAQFDTESWAGEACVELTRNTENKKDVTAFQELLNTTLNDVMGKHQNDIAEFIVKNPKYMEGDKAEQLGEQVGAEITLHLMQSCGIYQECILNAGEPLKDFDPLVIQVGKKIEQSVSKKSKKGPLAYNKAEKEVLKAVKSDAKTINSKYSGTSSAFTSELYLYLLTNSPSYARSQIQDWLK
jgi:hypothetical protein